ncbi:MAG: glucosamine-6-phosphate deaminase [Bacteroidetes bacterium]|nr:glucosamine-6-phosphate deaminase [Bacteroidota bacterium]MBS1972774.1 glucosamine-6-phosphate deaminase [Bacteroidota bacterium]
MRVRIFDDYDSLSQATASEVINLVKEKPHAVICLPSGSTPLGTCQWIVKNAQQQETDFSKCVFIGLDEWVGIGKENPGSCSYFFYHHFFDPLKIPEQQIFLFDAFAKNWSEECKKMDKTIAAKGGIDLMIVGIGMNGHIGFNEPGTSFRLLSHVTDLDETTKSVGQKYFPQKTHLSKGITLGLGHLMKANKAILIANGKNKAQIIHKALKEPVSEDMPASIMRKHSNGFFYVDKEAALLI